MSVLLYVRVSFKHDSRDSGDEPRSVGDEGLVDLVACRIQRKLDLVLQYSLTGTIVVV